MADHAGEKSVDKREGRLSQAQRNAEAIITHLSEYLSIRYDHAARINPKLRHMKMDLMYHELSNVRRTLLGDKIYGPIRMVVADVFISDDDSKRRRLISPSDQTSVQVELVSHCQDDKIEATRGQIKFHDLKGYYVAIDPDLVNFIDLFETWIWWDIFDAVELVRFEQKLGRIQLVRQGRVSEELRRYYSLLIHPLTEIEQQMQSVSDDDILRYEVGQLQYIRDQWLFRHQGELGYKFVLKREEQPAAYVGEMVHSIAAKVRQMDAIEAMEEVDPDIQVTYAGELHVVPEKVTRQMILELLQGQLMDLERDMLKQTDAEARLGPPFNFKERQIEQMDRWLTDLKRQLESILKAPEPKQTSTPAQAQPAAPAPTPPPRPAPAAAAATPPAPKPTPAPAPVSGLRSFDDIAAPDGLLGPGDLAGGGDLDALFPGSDPLSGDLLAGDPFEPRAPSH